MSCACHVPAKEFKMADEDDIILSELDDEELVQQNA